MTTKSKNPLDSITAGSVWVEQLLSLFWATDQAVKRGDDLPQDVRAVYELAEQARRQL